MMMMKKIGGVDDKNDHSGPHPWSKRGGGGTGGGSGGDDDDESCGLVDAL